MFTFNNRCTKPYVGNIRNGFSLMASLRCAMLTNRASQNYLVFLPIANTFRLPNHRNNADGTIGPPIQRKRRRSRINKMATLLHIQTSPRGSRSASQAVAEHFIDFYRKTHQGDTVETLNLWQTRLPEFDGATIDAKYAVVHGQPHSPEQVPRLEGGGSLR